MLLRRGASGLPTVASKQALSLTGQASETGGTDQPYTGRPRGRRRVDSSAVFSNHREISRSLKPQMAVKQLSS